MNTVTKFLSYAVFGLACCFGGVACDKGGDEPNDPTLVLTCSPTTANMGDDVTFTLKDDGVEVTSAFSILSIDEEGKTVTSPWVPARAGTYRFVAVYNGRTSAAATCKVNAGDTKTFKRRVLGMDFTGAQCAPCKNMTRMLSAYTKDNPDVLVVLAAHVSIPGYDAAETEETKTLNSTFNTGGAVPALSVDLRGACIGYSQTTLAGLVRKANENFPATCGIAISSTAEGQKVKADVTVQFSETNEFKICAVLLEDDLVLPAGNETSFHHVIRKYATGVFGDDIGEQIGGKEYKKTFEFTADATWKLENCHVVVYLLKKGENNVYTVNNVRDCPSTGSVEID